MFDSSAVQISSVPTFDAAGHEGGPSMLSFSASGPPMSSCAGWHATSPVAWQGLITTPSGSVTVVSFKPEEAKPSGFRPCGSLTVAVNPAGVSEKLVSGEIPIVGSKCCIRPQPVKPIGSPSGLCISKLEDAIALSSCHVPSISRLNSGGAPHEVGSVRKGTGLSPLPLCSAGTPHRVVLLKEIACCGT